MKSIIRKLLSTAIFGVVGGILIIGAIPLYRVYRVLIPALQHTQSTFQAEQFEDGIHALEQLDEWYQDYPPLFCEAARLQVRGWHQLNRPELAQSVITHTLAFMDSAPPVASTSVKDWIQLPAKLLALQNLESRYGAPSRDAMQNILTAEMNEPSDRVADRSDETGSPTPPDEEAAGESAGDERSESDVPQSRPEFTPVSFPTWAVIKTPNALMRTRTGKAIRALKPGTLLAVTAAPVVKGTERLYPCLQTSTAGAAINIHVLGRDLDFHPGELKKADPALKQIAIKRARILAALHKLENTTEAINPYRPLLTKVQAEQTALKKKIAPLTQKRNASVGEQRVEANDQLLSLRNRLAALDRKKQNLMTSMAEWETAQADNTTQDNRRDELQAALDLVNKQLLEAESTP